MVSSAARTRAAINVALARTRAAAAASLLPLPSTCVTLDSEKACRGEPWPPTRGSATGGACADSTTQGASSAPSPSTATPGISSTAPSNSASLQCSLPRRISLPASTREKLPLPLSSWSAECGPQPRRPPRISSAKPSIRFTTSASFTRSFSASFTTVSTTNPSLFFFPGKDSAESGNKNAASSSHSRSSPENAFANGAPPALVCAASSASSERAACRHPQAVPSGICTSASACTLCANTTVNSSKRHSSVSASPGDGPRSIPDTSFPTRSRLTLVRSAVCTSASVAACTMDGSSEKPKREANRTARRMRRGSSRNVVRGGSGVRTMPFCRSSSPAPVKSSTHLRLIL
mmetsp:Transcript_36077/g.57990  ORF Transcript_36077/g.57990 Transcript_36077/m.57990 type:complete len:348 (-) Transcript_36077:999-2042(-)